MSDDDLQTREQMLASLAGQSDGWVEHDGGPCPVPGGATVEVEHPLGILRGEAGILKWHRITRYRVVKP